MNLFNIFYISRAAVFGVLTLLAGLQGATASETDQQRVVAANNAFAFDLLGQITQTQSNANVFISPFSISTALQVVENGAAGQTEKEMQQVLHTADLPSTIVNQSFKELNQDLASRKDVTLKLANGIWYKQGFHLKSGFVADNNNFFQAELVNVDFSNPQSAQTINYWADKQTQGKIKNIVQYPFDPYTRVILANAIYFKGKWSNPFSKIQTKPRDFHPTSGQVKPTPMMVKEGQFFYSKTPDFEAVRLPYDGRFEMQIFLPTKQSSLQKLIECFKIHGNWRFNMQQSFSSYEGTLILPKFKIVYDIGLNDPLQALGMKHVFGNDADFSAMADEPLFISEVKQKSYVDVDEEGTEAAAVTKIEMHALSMEPGPPKPRFKMIVDRPFLFVIWETYYAGSILFIGVVNDPTTGSAQ
jgi:serpin B